MLRGLRLWLHRTFGTCDYSTTEYNLYPHIGTNNAAYVVCRVKGCRRRKIVRDITTEELRNDVKSIPINFSLK